MARAAIDIGSNSVLLTVVDEHGDVLHDEARVVGLGSGLGDRGVLHPDRMKACEQVLTEYLEVADSHGVEPWSVRAVATSAARRAMNAETWLSKLQRTTGLKVRIVTGEEEARLTWLGARRDLELPDATVMVVDIGGGSTELVLGDDHTVGKSTSLEIGSVRLTEEFLGTEVVAPDNLVRLEKYIDVMVDRFSFDAEPQALIGVAGTVTTLACMARGLQTYSSSAIHGSALTDDELAGLMARLLPATPEERRKLVPTAPKRADFLLAGAAILRRVLAATPVQSVLVSDRGLRFGLLSY